MSQKNLGDEISSNLVQRMKDAEPAAYGDMSVEEIRSDLKVDEVLDKLIRHHRKMMDIFENMYADVAYELTDVPMNIGYLRSKPYFDMLEGAMCELVEWGKPPVLEKNGLAAPKNKKAGFGGGKGMSGGGGGKKRKKKGKK